MKSFVTAVSFSLFSLPCLAQSGAVIPQGGAGHTAQASCVILKRMGPADQVTSHMYSFGIRGKQFQYVEGKLPQGAPFHGRLTDHDVRDLQGRGAEVIVLEAHYTDQDLKQARADCRGETGTTPNQSEAKSALAPSPTTASAEAQTGVAELTLSSTPAGADINIDGNFAGQTPSTLSLSAGDHTVSIEMTGYKSWERKIHTSGGKINLNATLAKAAATTEVTSAPADPQPDSLGDAARAARAHHASQTGAPQN
jgi:hypothetical protein